MSWLEQEGKRGGIHTGLRIISGGELEDAEYWAGCACRMDWLMRFWGHMRRRQEIRT